MHARGLALVELAVPVLAGARARHPAAHALVLRRVGAARAGAPRARGQPAWLGLGLG